MRIVGRADAASTSRFHSSATRVSPSAPEYSTVCGVLLTVVTGVLSIDRASTLPRWSTHFASGGCLALLSLGSGGALGTRGDLSRAVGRRRQRCLLPGSRRNRRRRAGD